MNSIIIDSAITSIKVSVISVLITFLIAIIFIFFKKYYNKNNFYIF